MDRLEQDTATLQADTDGLHADQHKVVAALCRVVLDLEARLKALEARG